MGRRWLAYWLVSLCGGGGLILLGTFVVRDRPEWSNGLVALGCLVAAIATAWTLVLPILAAVLLGLTLARALQLAAAAMRAGLIDEALRWCRRHQPQSY